MAQHCRITVAKTSGGLLVTAVIVVATVACGSAPGGRLTPDSVISSAMRSVFSAAARPTSSAESPIAALADPDSEDEFEGEFGAVFSPDGTMLAVPDFDGETDLWDVATHRHTAAVADPNSQGVDWAAFSPDGKMMATADENGSTYLWKVIEKG